MKKRVVVSLCVLALSVLAVISMSRTKDMRGTDENIKSAVSSLQDLGYSDVKVVDTHYLTAIMPGTHVNDAVIGTIDSITVTANKDGRAVRLKVRDIDRPVRAIEEL